MFANIFFCQSIHYYPPPFPDIFKVASIPVCLVLNINLLFEWPRKTESKTRFTNFCDWQHSNNQRGKNRGNCQSILVLCPEYPHPKLFIILWLNYNRKSNYYHGNYPLWWIIATPLFHNGRDHILVFFTHTVN